MNVKKNFLTGLAILLPIAVTFWIIAFLVNLLTNPFIGIVKNLLSNFYLHGHSLSSLVGPNTIFMVSRILILIGLTLITFLAGFLAQILLVKYIFKFGDYLIHRIPLVNRIYKASKEIVQSLFSEEKKSFNQVVLVPFPNTKAYAIGLVTGHSLPEGSDPEHMNKLSIFVPGTPNPTMGFMLLFNKEQVIFLDMKNDEALKFVVSCGVMSNNLKIKEKVKEELQS